jgi:hypothetical protein
MWRTILTFVRPGDRTALNQCGRLFDDLEPMVTLLQAKFSGHIFPKHSGAEPR